MASRKKVKKSFSKFVALIISSLIVAAVCIFVIFRFLPVKIDSLTFYPQNIPNSKINAYFSQRNDLYMAKLDGSRPKKIASVLRQISSIVPLPNGDVLIYGNGRYMGKGNKNGKEMSYETEGDAWLEKYWIIKSGSSTLQNIDEEEYNKLAKLSEQKPKYYTRELSSGGANIMLEKFDGTEPVKIGYLKEKIDTVGYCDNGRYKIHPRGFTPSYNGSYLLSSGAHGGGVCYTDRHVITNDGSIIFNLNKEYESIAWIGDNMLLISHNTDSKSEIITLSNDGTFETEVLDLDLRSYSFDQSSISPSKKLLFIASGVGLRMPQYRQAAIYDIASKSLISINTPFSTAEWIGKNDTILMRKVEEVENEKLIYDTLIYDPETTKTYKLATFSKASRLDEIPAFVAR